MKSDYIKNIKNLQEKLDTLEKKLIDDGIINKDKLDKEQRNAEELQAIHGVNRGPRILFSMVRGEYLPKSNPNPPSYETSFRADTQPTAN